MILVRICSLVFVCFVYFVVYFCLRCTLSQDRFVAISSVRRVVCNYCLNAEVANQSHHRGCQKRRWPRMAQQMTVAKLIIVPQYKERGR